jgi:hypothetical protein
MGFNRRDTGRRAALVAFSVPADRRYGAACAKPPFIKQ